MVKAPKPLQKAILEKMPPDAIKAIKEICSNLLHGNLQLNKNTQKQLTRYKSAIRSVASARSVKEQRKKLLNQKGGFVPVLVGALLSSVVGKLLDKYAH